MEASVISEESGIFQCWNCNLPNRVNTNTLSNLIQEMRDYYIKQVKEKITTIMQASRQSNPNEIKLSMPPYAYHCIFGDVYELFINNRDILEGFFSPYVLYFYFFSFILTTFRSFSKVERRKGQYGKIVLAKCEKYDHRFKVEYKAKTCQLKISFWFCIRDEKGMIVWPLLLCGCIPETQN